METQGTKRDLPPLLAGSGFDVKDPERRRAHELVALAISIAVHAENEKANPTTREQWYKAFQDKCRRADEFWERNQRWIERAYPDPSRGSGPSGGDTLAHWAEKWLKKALAGEPDWLSLYKLITFRMTGGAKNVATDWWDEVQLVCTRAGRGDPDFEPFAEIERISAKYEGRTVGAEQATTKEAVCPDKAGQKDQQKPMKDRFHFDEDCASFDGQDLGITNDEQREMLKSLAANWGSIVPFKELDPDGLPKAASDRLRATKSRLDKVLRGHEIKAKIKNKKGRGYLIAELDPQ